MGADEGEVGFGSAYLAEAKARRRRSIAILAREGVPCGEFLPVIEAESMIPRRADQEVAVRAIALAIVATKAQTRDQEDTRALIEDFRIGGSFTPKERAFIDEPQPAQRDCVQLTWRVESVWVLLWALGFIAALGRPDHQADPQAAIGIIAARGRDGFVAQARLRPASELLDAADLLYRYHWAVREAQIQGRSPPPNLDPGVVSEWHYALNWLIGYGDAEWDDVSTDT